MSVRFLKEAEKNPATGEAQVRDIVAKMLAEIEEGGDAAARAFGRKLDGYEGEIEISRATIEAAARSLPDQLKRDIAFAHKRVHDFAVMQKESLREFEAELSPGLWAGQRLIPVETAGCYVPGGRYAHVASAIMSITTA
jgi:sulfopropanediol 3-dehydrogenase